MVSENEITVEDTLESRKFLIMLGYDECIKLDALLQPIRDAKKAGGGDTTDFTFSLTYIKCEALLEYVASLSENLKVVDRKLADVTADRDSVVLAAKDLANMVDRRRIKTATAHEIRVAIPGAL